MCEPISITNNKLIPYICTNRSNEKFVNKELFSRILAFVVPFFQFIDTCSNLGALGCRLGGRLFKCIGLNIVSDEFVTNEKIKGNWKGVTNSLLTDLFLSVRTFISPPTIEEAALGFKDSDKENWELNKHFGHVFVINLTDPIDPKDPHKFAKKLEKLKENAAKIGNFAFERIAATYGKTDLTKDVWGRVDDNSTGCKPEDLDRVHMGQAGCLMSHYRIIKEADARLSQAQKELGEAQKRFDQATNEVAKKEAIQAKELAQNKVKEYSNILILEEDNRFGYLHKPNKTTWATPYVKGTEKAFKKVMSELPTDWDMVYFCSVECGPEGKQWMSVKSPEYSKNLNKLQYGLLTNAVAVNSRAYKTILDSLSKIDNPTAKFKPVDHEYALLHKSLNVFTPKKPLAYQAPGDSTITKDITKEPWDGSCDRRIG